MAKTYDDYEQQIEEYESKDTRNPEQLWPMEYFWAEHQPWLATRGYMLRARYHPDWVPSWRGNKKSYDSCEDGTENNTAHLMDATRIADGATVALKMIWKSIHPFEVEIGQLLSCKALLSDPENHCVPILEVLAVPKYKDLDIIVMPFLRLHHKPSFKTIGESVEFFRQVFEGLRFMHKHHVAHRDCSGSNIMMDATALYPDGFHPIWQRYNKNYRGYARHHTRTERPPKYYLTDFGLSRRYDPKNGEPLELPIRGGDKTVPEFQKDGYDVASDPFATDIYYVGNMVKTEFLDPYLGLEFMTVLILDMIQDDPSKRPTADEVMARFEVTFQSLRTSQLRSRLMHRSEVLPDYKFIRWGRNCFHFFRQVKYTLQRIPPVPRPSLS